MNKQLTRNLCTKEGNCLEIYSVYKKEDAIKQYRKELMPSSSFYKFTTTDKDNPFLSNECNEENRFTKERIILPRAYGYTSLERSFNIAQCLNLKTAQDPTLEAKRKKAESLLAFLEDYLQGKLDGYDPKILYDYSHNNGSIIFRGLADQVIEDASCECRTYYHIKRILELPEELYLLQLMLNRNIISLRDRDIDNLLKLFEFERTNRLSLNDVKELTETGIISDSYEKVIENAEIGNDILRRTRTR